MNPTSSSSRPATQAPIALPPGYVGPVCLPGTQREVWWTGRVAIGLRYEPRHTAQTTGESASWLQDLLLRH